MCRFDQLGQAQRPPSVPRPSAADLSSGRVPEPSQPVQSPPPEAQRSPQQPEQQQQQQGEQPEEAPDSEQQQQQQQQLHPMQQGYMTPQQYQQMQLLQFQRMVAMQQMMAMQQQGMLHGARGPGQGGLPWNGHRQQQQQQQQQPRPIQGNQVCVSPVSACLRVLGQLCARLRATASSGGDAGRDRQGRHVRAGQWKVCLQLPDALCVALSSLKSCVPAHPAWAPQTALPSRPDNSLCVLVAGDALLTVHDPRQPVYPVS